MARNFKTVGQGKLAKACDRLGMIVSEFFEKGRFYSWRLAVYNTAWWVGFYCPPILRMARLQFWATRSISKWMDAYLDRCHMAYADLTPPPISLRNPLKITTSGCSGGRERRGCRAW